MSGGIILLRPFLFQKSLCLTVSLLLPPKFSQRIPAMVPHLCGRAEAQFPTMFLQAPTHVDVVTSRSELSVKTTNCFKCGSQKGHVAAGDVFCFGISKQNMGRATGSVCHACSNKSVVPWRDVRPPHSGIIVGPEHLSQVAEPIRVRICVVIYIGDNLTIRRLPSEISGMAQTIIWRTDKIHVVLGCNCRCIICGPIVDDYHLKARVANLGDSMQTFADRSTSVETANHY